MLQTASTTGGTTTYTYREVDLTAEAVDANNDGNAEETRVTAFIPVATDYNHINFGVWNAMEDNTETKGGTLQEIAERGIGFVQNHDGSGMTEEMPNMRRGHLHRPLGRQRPGR